MKLSEKRTFKKKEQILATAIEIINRRGYSGATMEKIAAELSMTKGSLYYYFKNKSDLMYQCHNFVLFEATEDLKGILNGDGSVREILHKMIAAHIEYAVDERETFNLIMQPKLFFKREQVHLVLKLRKSYEDLFTEIISRGIESGEFTAKEPSIARMIILGAMNWIQQWYKPDGKLSKQQLKDLYSEYVMKILE